QQLRRLLQPSGGHAVRTAERHGEPGRALADPARSGARGDGRRRGLAPLLGPHQRAGPEDRQGYPQWRWGVSDVELLRLGQGAMIGSPLARILACLLLGALACACAGPAAPAPRADSPSVATEAPRAPKVLTLAIQNEIKGFVHELGTENSRAGGVRQ